MTNRGNPLFRADHVGSLLRPPAIVEARAATLTDGALTSPDLKPTEDAAIADVVAMQESLGLGLVTDGEFRRSFWHYDFMDGLTGLNVVQRTDRTGVQFSGPQLRPYFPEISERIDFPDDHPMLDHFRYLSSVATATPKISIPGPSACHFRTAADD
ncbi:hypothetical protein OAC41_06920, partial [Acidimicrobiales bacterium]|nr:hypothetical protein [Acidimicrobiales bacterium]